MLSFGLICVRHGTTSGASAPPTMLWSPPPAASLKSQVGAVRAPPLQITGVQPAASEHRSACPQACVEMSRVNWVASEDWPLELK